MHSRKPTLALALILVVSPLFAADTAKGVLHFGKATFEPVDAMAFDDPTTVVVLTNFKIDRPAVMAEISSLSAFAQQSATVDHGAFVVVRVVPKDQCGLTAFLEQAQRQIDLGESFPGKHVTVAGHVAGSCRTDKPGKLFDDAYDFHFTYDLPMTIIPAPDKLPAGGGEAGAAYLAIAKKTDDPNYPKTATIPGGLIKGDRANLEIKGVDRDGKKIRGAVMMKKVSGSWTVLDQSFFFVE